MAWELRNWWIKPLVLHHTNVVEAILLDLEDIFMLDPSVLRFTRGYKPTRTAFFYDRVIEGNDFFNKRNVDGVSYLKNLLANVNYAQFGLRDGFTHSPQLNESFAFRGETIHEQDSSVVVMNKNRVGKAMDTLWWLINEERFKNSFSFGNKESFWLTFELAKQDYFFSPWGTSVIDSSTNRDLENHRDSLCGSTAQFMPMEDDMPEVIYVNGKATLESFPEGPQATTVPRPICSTTLTRPTFSLDSNKTRAVEIS